MDLLEQLLGHDRWATGMVLERSRALSDEQLDRPFDVGHRTLRSTLDHHTYIVGFWTELMQGRPVPPRSEGISISELAERHERSYAAFADLARRLRAEGRLDETFIDHYGHRCKLGTTIIQVVLHNGLHRAEAMHMLRHLGVAKMEGDWDPQEWEWDTKAVEA